MASPEHLGRPTVASQEPATLQWAICHGIERPRLYFPTATADARNGCACACTMPSLGSSGLTCWWQPWHASTIRLLAATSASMFLSCDALSAANPASLNARDHFRHPAESVQTMSLVPVPASDPNAPAAASCVACSSRLAQAASVFGELPGRSASHS